jgi:L-malate glycosyltransferase
VRVLYVNHTSEVSGGERSLLDLLASLRGDLDITVACPPGRLTEMLHAAGTPTAAITGTAGSLRLHPVHTPRALAEIARAAWEVRTLARRLRSDVVHANSIRAGLITALAAGLGAPRPVVHLRDVLPGGAVTSATFEVLGRGAAVLVANSAYTAGRLPLRGDRVAVRVVHNPVDLRRLDPGRVDGAGTRAALGLPADAFVAAVIAQLTPWKGQDDAIRAVGRLAARHPHLRLLLVGAATFVDRATRYDNATYVDGLHRLVAEQGLEDRVSFLGQRDDVPELLAASDAVLLPSWEEPFGRAVAEGMAMGVPVLATSVGGPREILEDGRHGFLLPPREPETWARALDRLVTDPQLGRRLGAAGREHALVAFDPATHARRVKAVYETALAGGVPRPDVDRSSTIVHK